jgi:hypothetical protein
VGKRSGERGRRGAFATLAIVIAIIATTMGRMSMVTTVLTMLILKGMLMIMTAVMPTMVIFLTIMDDRHMTFTATMIAILSRLVDVLCCPSRTPQAGGSFGRADNCISHRYARRPIIPSRRR